MNLRILTEYVTTFNESRVFTGNLMKTLFFESTFGEY